MTVRYALLAAALIAAPARAGLPEYIAAKDPAYAWSLRDKQELPTGAVYDLAFTSQTWQGITWKHRILVFRPKDAKPTATMMLLNTGGNGDRPTDRLLGLRLSEKIGAPVAVLFNVPNQPLFDGKKEDGLIAETFVRFLDGGGKDDSWPLLFPMAKSVVRAMDALQEFAMKELPKPVEKFVISGASKRGWTTWLTAASGDTRVKAIVPMVIDVLNMVPQMVHQKASFGTYSQMIRDYTERELVPIPDTEKARRLWQMVDPYAYRAKYTLPKLVVNGANDPYWTVDALNFYWDDLPGPKWVIIVPNAGHDLREVDAAGGKDLATRAVDSIAAFVRAQIFDEELPQLRWKHEQTPNDWKLSITATPAPKSARLWVANSESRDFRLARWEAKELTVGSSGEIVGGVTPPASGFRVFYGEVEYDRGGLTQRFSTQVHVGPAK